MSQYYYFKLIQESFFFLTSYFKSCSSFVKVVSFKTNENKAQWNWNTNLDKIKPTRWKTIHKLPKYLVSDWIKYSLGADRHFINVNQLLVEINKQSQHSDIYLLTVDNYRRRKHLEKWCTLSVSEDKGCAQMSPWFWFRLLLR